MRHDLRVREHVFATSCMQIHIDGIGQTGIVAELNVMVDVRLEMAETSDVLSSNVSEYQGTIRITRYGFGAKKER